MSTALALANTPHVVVHDISGSDCSISVAGRPCRCPSDDEREMVGTNFDHAAVFAATRTSTSGRARVRSTRFTSVTWLPLRRNSASVPRSSRNDRFGCAPAVDGRGCPDASCSARCLHASISVICGMSDSPYSSVCARRMSLP